MSNSAYRAQLPQTRLTAVAAMLAAILALTFALTHHQDLADAARLAGLAYGGVVFAVLYRAPNARPLAVLLATVHIVAALVAALSRVVRLTSRQEVWA